MSSRDLSVPPLDNQWLDYSKFTSDIPPSKTKLPFTIIPIRAPLENPNANKLLKPDELWTFNEIIPQISSYLTKKYNKKSKILSVIDLTGSDIDSEKYYKGSHSFHDGYIVQ